MTNGALASMTFGVVRAVAVVMVLVILVGLIALFLARRLARTRKARQGLFLGLSGTGLIFVAFVAWTWLQSMR